MSKCYSEFVRLPTIEERVAYLRLSAQIGNVTFGYDRMLNQTLYRSNVWRNIRRQVILRDESCDLAFPGYEIAYRPVVHHIVPLTIEQIEANDNCIFALENLITLSHDTHMLVHYGDNRRQPVKLTVRTKGDTSPWKQVY